MTPSDWEGLGEVFVAALTILDLDILAETHRITVNWEDKPEGLVWDDGLGRKEGQIWIPELDDLWKKVMGLYHDSPVTGCYGTGFHDRAWWIYLSVRLHTPYLSVVTEWVWH